MYSEDSYSEKELLLLIAKGDIEAYQELFNKYWGQVYGTAQRLTKSPEQAKDLAQDIFLKLWNDRAKLPEIRNIQSFLYTVTKNLIHDQVRTRIFHESNKEFLLSYFSYDERSPHEKLEQKELGNTLAQAISQLPIKLNQVFTLHRLEGLSHEEIGKKLNIHPLSSKTYMVRALAQLRKILSGRPENDLLLVWISLEMLRL